MTSDRKNLREIMEEICILQAKADAITKHPCGKSYGKIISDLIYKYIDNSYTDKRSYYMTPSVYSEYSKLHQEISSICGVKTQVFTREEYQIAITYMANNWQYDIPPEYQL